ncbi:hypothetical protein KJ980_07185 [Patescibacteria group bacterium]|nr:hypothetical protein [Patescibacteria group bacterium]MBU4016972.1 hypothetical protein [Patescibacteria group bacterium]MBU4099405.1 hypothetical protein [Patescibacteria group bacterium]
MNLNEVIKEKYGSYAFEKAGELLFKWPDVLKIINYCEKNNIIVVGMNFWIQRGKDIIEINSTNYEDINIGFGASQKTTKAARALIKDKLPDNASYVSFVLGYETQPSK